MTSRLELTTIRVETWARLAFAVLGLLVCGTILPGPTSASTRPRVAIIKSAAIPQFEEAGKALSQALSVHPRQPELFTFDLGGNANKGPELLSWIISIAPDVLVPIGSLAASAVVDAQTSIPIVFAMVLYPEQSRFWAGTDNITGASLDIPASTYFEQMGRISPGVKRIGVLYNPKETGKIIDKAKQAAGALGLSLEAVAVESSKEVLTAFDGLLPRVDFIWTVADSQVFTAQTTPALLLASIRARVPMMGLSTAHVRAGATAALSCDYAEIGKQAADLAGQILNGRDPGDLPISAPRNVRLALNVRAAEHIGLRIDSEVRRGAIEVNP